MIIFEVKFEFRLKVFPFSPALLECSADAKTNFNLSYYQ